MTLLQAAVATLIAASAVVAAGTFLARSADVIAARTRLGGVWVGSVLLAAATSLPEMTTDIAAVRIGAPDLAAGDLFGSSMANMLILAVITLLPAGSELFRRAALDHVLYAALAIVLTTIAATFVLFRVERSIFGLGVGSVALAVTYAIGSRAVYRHTALASRGLATVETMDAGESGEAATQTVVKSLPSLRRALIMFAVAAVVILVAAPAFARSAEAIAQITGIGSTFIGTWLVGASTSLPELVTSLAAVRLRAYDLAVGNLFGSNAFNMVIFVTLDLASTDGPILSIISLNHALSALTAIALMSIGVAALVYRAEGRLKLLEPSSALLVIGYLAGLALLLAANGER
jgi:cation:H+ antiporter